MDCPWPWIPTCCLQPPWNWNDFLPLNSPGGCCFPHPERFGHSFPAGFHTLATKPSHAMCMAGPWVSQLWSLSLPGHLGLGPSPGRRLAHPACGPQLCCFLSAAHAVPVALPPTRACLLLCTLERGSPACLFCLPCLPSSHPALF